MKKLFAGIFATVLGFGCLTACGEKTEYDVEGAADYLDAMYIEQIEDGRVDYEVLNTFSFGGVKYDVEWSVNVTENITLVRGETTTKVDVNEAATQDVDYELTAIVKDPNGQTATVKFLATLLKAKALIPVAITEKPVAGTAYKLYVYNNDAKKDCYFDGNYQATFYLGSVEDYEDSVDVYVEYVENSDTKFNLYFDHQLDGKQYLGIRENWNSTKNYWSYNPVIAGEPVSSFEYSTEHNTIITTVPACSEDKQDATQDTTKTIYWGNSGGTYTSIGGVDVSKINESGYVANLVKMESAANVSATDKIAFEKDALLLDDSYVGDNTVDVATIGKRYPDVQISWAVTGDNIAYADGKITITAPTANTTVTVTATFTLGETTDTKEFTITLKPAVNVPAANSTLTIPEAIALGNQFEHNTYTEGKYYVSGTVKSITNTTYGNMYIEDDNGNELLIYGVADEEGNRYDAMTTKPVVGDTITVYGIIGKYSSNAQMKNATMTAYTAGAAENPLEAPVKTIDEVLAMSITSDTTEKYRVTGEITEIYNTNYGNMKIKDADGTILTVYGTYNEDGTKSFSQMEAKPQVGDTVTFYSVISQYNGTPQLKNAWMIDVVAPLPAADTELTIDRLLMLNVTADTTDKFYVTGKIVEIYNTTYGNMYIEDENGTRLTVYGTYNEDGTKSFSQMEAKPQVGDTVKFYGILSTYNGKNQMKNAWIMEVTAPQAPEAGANVAEISFADATNRTVNTTSQQVFVQNGVTFTYDKNTSNNFADYTNPIRCYSGTKITIAREGIKKITVTCASADYATALVNSIGTVAGVTATANGSVVTITFTEAVNTFQVVLSAQVRIAKIEVVY